jgi:hypothetical protein
MLEPHPHGPVPIYYGGDSDAALRRAARHCDGWVGTRYPLEDAARRAAKLRDYRRQYGREDQPFEVIVALEGTPSPELYQRAEELGVTGAMCSPWAEIEDIHAGAHDGLKQPAERYRAAIESFAEQVVAKCR